MALMLDPQRAWVADALEEARAGQEQVERAARALLRRQARREANAWLTRLPPLLDDPASLGPSECRARIRLLRELRVGAERLLAAFDEAIVEDRELAAVLQQAAGLLDAIERSFQRRLGFLLPNDPDAAADLPRLRERLAGAQARLEVEGASGTLQSEAARLVYRLERRDWVRGLLCGVVGGGWLAGSTSALAAAVREPSTLAFWPFVAIALFWLFGIMLLGSAARALTERYFEIMEQQATVRRTLGPWAFDRQRRTLGAGSRASLEPFQGSGMLVAVTDAEGDTFYFGSGWSQARKERVAAELNEYILARSL